MDGKTKISIEAAHQIMLVTWPALPPGWSKAPGVWGGKKRRRARTYKNRIWNHRQNATDQRKAKNRPNLGTRSSIIWSMVTTPASSKRDCWVLLFLLLACGAERRRGGHTEFQVQPYREIVYINPPQTRLQAAKEAMTGVPSSTEYRERLERRGRSEPIPEGASILLATESRRTPSCHATEGEAGAV